MLFGKYDLDKLVDINHPLRKINQIVPLGEIAEEFNELAKETGRKGYGVDIGIKCLFLQFYYDLSDRQLEERLHYDIVFKLFCNFTLENETPDHTYFCWIRKVLGTERVAKVFRVINEKAKDKKILRSVFSFVDSSHIKVKETTWEERDKAIAD